MSKQTHRIKNVYLNKIINTIVKEIKTTFSDDLTNFHLVNHTGSCENIFKADIPTSNNQKKINIIDNYNADKPGFSNKNFKDHIEDRDCMQLAALGNFANDFDSILRPYIIFLFHYII